MKVMYVLPLDQAVRISALIICLLLHAIATYIRQYSPPPRREKSSFLIYNDNGVHLWIICEQQLPLVLVLLYLLPTGNWNKNKSPPNTKIGVSLLHSEIWCL